MEANLWLKYCLVTMKLDKKGWVVLKFMLMWKQSFLLYKGICHMPSPLEEAC